MNRDKSIFKEAAEVGARKLLEFFNAPKENRDIDAAQLGVKAGSNFARMYAAETNRLATEMLVARAIGLNGEALLPLFEDVSGIEAQKYLPGAREGSEDGAQSGKRSRNGNQRVARSAAP